MLPYKEVHLISKQRKEFCFDSDMQLEQLIRPLGSGLNW